MNFWKEDPEGMDEKVVEAMRELGHAIQGDDEQETLQRFNSPAFGRTQAWLDVATQAEGNYQDQLVTAAEYKSEAQRHG